LNPLFEFIPETAGYRIALHAPADRAQVRDPGAWRHGRTPTWSGHLHIVTLGTSLA
jgi:hypothetical protein